MGVLGSSCLISFVLAARASMCLNFVRKDVWLGLLSRRFWLYICKICKPVQPASHLRSVNLLRLRYNSTLFKSGLFCSSFRLPKDKYFTGKVCSWEQSVKDFSEVLWWHLSREIRCRSMHLSRPRSEANTGKSSRLITFSCGKFRTAEISFRFDATTIRKLHSLVKLLINSRVSRLIFSTRQV